MATISTFVCLAMLLMSAYASANRRSGIKESSTVRHIVKRSPETLTSASQQKEICRSGWSDSDKWVPSKELKESFPVETVGSDYDGNPVRIIHYGKWNVRQWVEERGEQGIKDFQKYVKYEVHRTVQLGTTSRRDEGVVLIMDWEGFNLSHYASVQATKLSLEQFGTLAQLFCVLNYGFYVNTNFAADVFISLAKPFIGNFLEKIEIYGTQHEKWIPKLLRKIPKSQLPRSYGGDKEDIRGDTLDF